jgi:PAS domain S-box-containing protein
MTGRPDKKILWGLGLAVFAIAGMGGIFYTGTALLIADAERVDGTHNVISTLTDFYTQVQDIRRSTGGYVINGDDRFLQRRNVALRRAKEELQSLKDRAHPGSQQEINLRDLQNLFEAKLKEADQLIQIRRSQGLLMSLARIRQQFEKDLDDNLREHVDQMTDDHRAQLTRRGLDAQNSSRAMLMIVVAGSIAEVLVALAAALAIRRNIRERQKALVALQHGESILRSFYDSGVLMMGIIEVLDDDLRYLSHNGATGKLLGVTDLFGKTSTEIGVPRQYIDLWLENYRRAVEASAPIKFEYLRAQNGGHRWLEAALCPIPTPAGVRPRFSFTINDVTERHQAEDAIRKHAAELSAAKDALELNSRQLELARTAADSANQSKSTFLANMSHEIRTPLTSILGYAELVLEPDQTASDRHDCLQVIRRSAKHLLELINEVLDLSKIEAGRMTVESIPCNPAQLLSEVVSMVRPRAEEKNVSMRLEFDGAFPDQVKSDPLRLRQVLMNLVGNAVKFTSAGEIIVHAKCSRDDAGHSHLNVAVADTGIGMSADEIQGCFRPFTQADETTTRRFGGTGLGLTISKRLAEMLGGDISVRSEIGKGSTFTLAVDTGDLADAHWIQGLTEGVFVTHNEKTAARDTVLHGHILLVEDGRDNQRLISTHLRKAGAQVTIAENGREAVDLVKSQQFDLVLMDMQMPLLDGYDATRQLRRLGFTLPILALTAHAMSGDREKCIAAGCSDYLTKPIDKSQLIWTIATHLGDKPKSGPASAAAPQTSQPSELLKSEFADDAEMRELVEHFTRELPEQVGKINAMLQGQQMDELRRIVHQLKGAGGGYGFTPITTEAARAENLIKHNHSLEEIDRSVRSLVETIRRVEGYQPSQEDASCLKKS